MEALDRSAAEWMSSLHWPVVTPVMKGLTYAGAAGLVWIVLAAVVAVWLRRPLVLIAVIGTITLSSRLAAVLKDASGRARPFVGDPSVHPSIALPHDPSMPSGHAMNAFAGAVLLGAVVPRARRPLLVLAVLIALSRVYLGVHFPSDVIAGALLGSAVGAAAAWLLAHAERALARSTANPGSDPERRA
jgi:undecaprenyl-diphosphatase